MAASQASAPRAVTPTPAVEVRRLVKEFGDRRGSVVRAVDDVSLAIREGEFFALLGPSGCGKTTTLRAIAGFEEPTSGEILLRGRPVHGVPPFHRPVNTVFQDYALFPHMSVRQNVMFGLRMARVAPPEARRRADEALELVHLPGVADRRPGQLSGGQQQRVALARALVNRPAVLLLDEPLGALDLKLRKAMQYELKQLQQRVGITFVYVTHDQEEALTMADRIAVMSAGKALQVGSPDEVYERPSNRFVADFIGETNFLAGILESREPRAAGSGSLGVVRLDGGSALRAVLRDPDAAVGAAAAVAVRPEKIGLRPASAEVATGPAETMPMSELRGRVVEAHYIGTDTRYRVRVGDGIELVVRVQNQHAGFDGMLAQGTEVVARWRTDHGSVLA
jgi:spermidine/putrescine transport system ATP-binding protein